MERRKFTREFKLEAVRLIRDRGVITSSRRTAVASGLGVWSSVDTSRSPIQRSHNSPSPTAVTDVVPTSRAHSRLILVSESTGFFAAAYAPSARASAVMAASASEHQILSLKKPEIISMEACEAEPPRVYFGHLS